MGLRALALCCGAFLLAGAAQAANTLNFSYPVSHNLGIASQGAVFNAQLQPAGSNGTFTVSVAPGSSLPPGLRLVTGGTWASTAFYLQGLPAWTGTLSFTLNISDNLGNTGSGTFTATGSPVYIDQSDFNRLAASTVASLSKQLVAGGGTPPYTWASSNIPLGLSLSASGLLTGTPLATGSAPFDVTVTDAYSHPATAQYFLYVAASALTTSSLPDATAGTPYSGAVLSASGPASGFNVLGLPPGMAVNYSTGVISGTPTIPGQYVLNVSVADSSGGTRPYWIPLAVQGAAPRSTFTGLLSPPDTPSGATVGLPYSYEFTSLGRGYIGGKSYSVSVVPGTQLPPGLNLITAAQVYPYMGRQPYLIRGVPTQAGNFKFALQIADAFGNLGQQTYRLSVGTGIALPVYGSTAYGLRGTPYQQQLSFSGACAGACAFTLDFGSLPAGLTLSSSGLISGTPTDTGEINFRVMISDGVQTVRQWYLLQVASNAPGYPDLNLQGPYPFDPYTGGNSYSSRLDDLVIGSATGMNFVAQNGCSPCSWSLVPGSQLPPGMSLGTTQTNVVSLSGTPITPGTYTFTLQASNALGQSGFHTYLITVSPLGVPANQSNLPPGQTGLYYLHVLSGRYGSPPYQFTLSPSSLLPDGLQLLSNGELVGVPASAGAFSFGYTMTDSNGYVLTQSASFVTYPEADYYPVSAGGTAIYTSSGASYSLNLDQSVSGIGPFTWQYVSGNQVPGMTIGLQTQGSPPVSFNALYGTAPTLQNTTEYDLTLRVTDGRGQTTTVLVAVIDFKMQISPDSLAPGALGVPYSQQLGVSNGTSPYSFAPQTLCAGLSLTASGLISGTPLSTCSSTLQVQVTDHTGAVAYKTYSLSFGPPGSAISALSLTPGALTVNYTIGDPLPSPLPVFVAGAPQSVAFGATTSGESWLKVSGSGTTPGQLTVTLDPTGLSAGSRSATIAVTAPLAYNSPQTIQVNLNVSNPAPCSGYVLSDTAWGMGAGGGSKTFNISTPSGCPWSVSLQDPSWVTLNTPSSGTGAGSVSYTLQPNTGPVRYSGIVIAGTSFSQTFLITQFGLSCSYSLQSASATVSAAGGYAVAALNVYGNAAGNAMVSNCPWTVSGAASWTTVNQPSGTGTAYIVIPIAANSGGSRSATLTIGGQQFTINQTGAGCSYSLSATSDSLPATGGTGRSIAVTAPSGCAWTAAAPSWIAITSGASGSGNGTVTYNVAPNSTTQLFRGTMVIAGQYVTVSEGGLACNYTVSGDNPVLPAGGGSGVLVVAASAAGCGWVASSDSTWLTVNPNNAPGSASLNYTASANLGSGARAATLTVAGQAMTVTQSGTSCSVQLAAADATVLATGGGSVVNSIGVRAPSGCAWNSSAGGSWVHIASGSGSGNGSITYSVDDNSPNGSARSAAITVTPGGMFTVNQPAPLACTYAPNYPNNGTYASADWPGGSSSFSYSASSPSCFAPTTIQSFSSWLTVQPGSYGSGAGTVPYQVAQTWASVPRTGYIMLGDAPFTLVQAANPCTYTLGATESSWTAAGGTGSVAITASLTSCTPYITPDANLQSVGLSGSGGHFTLAFTVPAFQPLVPSTRMLNIDIGPGQTYSAKQVSQ